MSTELNRRRFLMGMVAGGAVGLAGNPAAAVSSHSHWLSFCPYWLGDPLRSDLHIAYSDGDVERIEGAQESCSVVFHAGSTGWMGPPATPTGAHDVLCEIWTRDEAESLDLFQPIDSHWCEARIGPKIRAAAIRAFYEHPAVFPRLVESLGTEARPVAAKGMALITCVLNDPTAREAAVTVADLSQESGFKTYALVSVGVSDPDAEPDKSRTLRQLERVTEGVWQVPISEIVDCCGHNHPAERDGGNEAEYLCRLASVITNCNDRIQNVDASDIVNLLRGGGTARMKQLAIPALFRNQARPSMHDYADTASAWLDRDPARQKCLIHAPTKHWDETGLFSLAADILDRAERACGVGSAILALDYAPGPTIELLALSPAA